MVIKTKLQTICLSYDRNERLERDLWQDVQSAN